MAVARPRLLTLAMGDKETLCMVSHCMRVFPSPSLTVVITSCPTHLMYAIR